MTWCVNSAVADHGHEARLFDRIVLEGAGKGCGEGRGSRLLDAAHGHAHMLGLDEHRDTTRLQACVDRLGDLRSHVFLGLQAAGEDIDDAGNLGKPEDTALRQVGDMRLAYHGQHMVFAMREEGDVAHQYHVVIAADLLEGPSENLVDIGFIAGNAQAGRKRPLDRTRRGDLMKYLHTMVRVTDLEASLDFYCDKLGLRETRRREDKNGRYTLVFLCAPGDENAQIELTYNWDPEPYTGGRNFGHLAYEVPDIYAICAQLMAGGVTINRPPRDGRMAFVRSPDHISIELLQTGDSLELKEPWVSMPNTGEW